MYTLKIIGIFAVFDLKLFTNTQFQWCHRRQHVKQLQLIKPRAILIFNSRFLRSRILFTQLGCFANVISKCLKLFHSILDIRFWLKAKNELLKICSTEIKDSHRLIFLFSFKFKLYKMDLPPFLRSISCSDMYLNVPLRRIIVMKKIKK